jgi:hypothetical protein
MDDPRPLPVDHRRRFYRHFVRNAAFATVLVGLSLYGGALGYHVTEHLPWLDAVLNAAMILTGMGPVDKIQTPSGKLFATVYALFSGIVFLSTAALVLLPIGHRLLRRFHLELEDEQERKGAR